MKVKIPLKEEYQNENGTLESRLKINITDSVEIDGLHDNEELHFVARDSEKYYIGHGAKELSIGTPLKMTKAKIHEWKVYREIGGRIDVFFQYNGKTGTIEVRPLNQIGSSRTEGITRQLETLYMNGLPEIKRD